MLSINRNGRRKSAKGPFRSLGRRRAVGVAFPGCGLGLLYLFTDVLAIPLILCTLLAAEVTTLLWLAINDCWVFGQGRR
jgi:putative flippase GtrA